MPADETDISGPTPFITHSTIRPSAIGLRQIFPIQTNNTFFISSMDFDVSITTFP
jgi:hypothetical protein